MYNIDSGMNIPAINMSGNDSFTQYMSIKSNNGEEHQRPYNNSKLTTPQLLMPSRNPNSPSFNIKKPSLNNQF